MRSKASSGWASACVLALAAALLIGAGLALAEAAPGEPRGIDARRAVTRDASGRPTATRLLRSWRETVKIAGHDEPRRFEIVYDYAAGVARQRSYAADGALLADRPLAAQPQPSPEEVSDGVALLRADPELGALARHVGAVFDGGFVLDEGEGKPCGARTRCLQIFMLSPSRFALHRRTAVDLRAERIAHRSYQPANGE